MSLTYDYSEIINDDDWGLIQIIPVNNNTKPLSSLKSEPTSMEFESASLESKNLFLKEMSSPKITPAETIDSTPRFSLSSRRNRRLVGFGK